MSRLSMHSRLAKKKVKRNTTAARTPAPSSYSGARKTTSRAAFLPNLYDVLNDVRYQDIIHWDDSGTVVVVKDAHRLSTELCPTVWQQKDVYSWSRQMNIWRWKRIEEKGGDKGGEKGGRGSLGTRSSQWRHETLDRWSSPSDLAAVTRKVPPRTATKKQPRAEVVPPVFPDYLEFEDDGSMPPHLTPTSTAPTTPTITPATTPATSPSPVFRTRPVHQVPGMFGQFFFHGSPLMTPLSHQPFSSWSSHGLSLPQTPQMPQHTPRQVIRPSQLRQSYGASWDGLPQLDLHQLGLADGVTAAEVEGLVAKATNGGGEWF